MVLSDGSVEPLFTRPISAVLAVITISVVCLAIPPVQRRIVDLLAVFPFIRSGP
jgi:hypothetical protein